MMSPSGLGAVVVTLVLGAFSNVLLAGAGDAPLADADGKTSGQNIGQRFVEVYGTDFQFEIKGFKGKRAGVVCREFELSREEVQFFFTHAKFIRGYEMEKKYAWFPCQVAGTLTVGNTALKWTISPVGKGVLRSESDELIYLVCDVGCRELFPEGGSMFEDYLSPKQDSVLLR